MADIVYGKRVGECADTAALIQTRAHSRCRIKGCGYIGYGWRLAGWNAVWRCGRHFNQWLARLPRARYCG